MRGTHWRGWLLGAVTVGGVAAACWFPPLPQDPTYHVFADRRTFFGIPNFWNVCSNLASLLLDSRVVDVPRAYNRTFVMLSSFNVVTSVMWS